MHRKSKSILPTQETLNDMDREEYEIKRREIEKAKLAEIRRFENEIKKKYEAMLVPYKEERIKTLNTRNIEVGDIITDGEVILKVGYIGYVHATIDRECYIDFTGEPLTKKFAPCKKALRSFIQQRYGRVPTIIKKHE